MTRFFRGIATALLVSLGLAVPASATVHSIDFTDIWYIPAESGWGVNLIQQGDVIFATLFVYGEDRSARWYVAPALVPQTAVAGTFVFRSPLLLTRGTPFSTLPFDASSVTNDEVGEMTLTFSSPTSGQLVYRIGTTTITKMIQRQSFRGDAPTGRFIGGLVLITSACTDPNLNNRSGAILGAVTGTIATGNVVTFRIDYLLDNGATAVCNMAGPLATQGKLASINNGSWACGPSNALPAPRPFSITSLDTQVNGIHGTFTGTDQFCTYNGRFGGVRDVVN